MRHHAGAFVSFRNRSRLARRSRRRGQLESLEERRLLAVTAVDDTFAAAAGSTTSLNAAMGVMANDEADITPIMHYRLDETTINSSTTVQDSSNNSYFATFLNLADFNGTVSGNVTSVPGMAGTAYRFDGNDDYIDLQPVFPLWEADSFSFATWFNREADIANPTNHAVQNVLIAQSSPNANDNLEIGTVGTDIVIYLDAVGGETTATYSNPNINIQDNTWYHLAVTYDGAELKIFLDGAEVANDTTSFAGMFDDNNTEADTTPVSIGAARPDAGDPWGEFQGTIDDVQIYGQALTAAQVAALHASPGTIVADSPALTDTFLASEATLNFDANLENDLNWESSPPVAGFDIGLDASVTLETVTSAYPGIQQAYRFTAGGGSLPTLQNLPGNPSDDSAAWEFWLRPTGAAGPQTIFESGGNGDGMIIWYDGTSGVINFTLDNGATQDTVSGNIASTTEFTHVVAVYGNDVDMANPSADFMQLYLNGVEVDTNMGFNTDLNDWAGGDAGDIAQLGSNNIAQTGSAGDFVGDIAKLRFYEEALTPVDVRSRYSAIAASATLQTGPSNASSFTFNPDGSFDYTNDGTQGPDTFTYSVSDGLGGNSTATVTINVIGANVDPVANPDTAANGAVTDEDTPVTIDVLANDADPDSGPSPLVIQSVDGSGLLGSVTLNNNQIDYDPGTAFQVLDETQSVTETFSYTIFDGIATDTATVTVTVNGVNDVPVAAADTATTDEDTAVTGNVLANDSDIDGVDNSFTLNFEASSDTNGDAWEDSAGQLDWRLDSLSGTAPALTSVTSGMTGITQAYQFTGGGTGGDNAFQLLNNANDDFRSGQDIPGNASNDSVTIEMWFKPDSLPLPGGGGNTRQTLFEDGGGTGLGLFVEGNELVARKLPTAGEIRFDISSLASDFIQAVVTYRTNTNPDEMELFVNGMSVGTDVSNNGNDWTGGDGAALGGRGQNNTGGQGGGDSNSESFSGQIAIFRLYESILPMSVIDDNFRVVAAGSGVETQVVSEVNGNAADVDQPITLPSGAALTLNANGSFTYDPSGAFDATSSIDTLVDTFQYTVDDGSGGTATESVTITVDGINDAPTAVDDNASATESGSTTILSADVLSNDFDVDGLISLSPTLNYNAALDLDGDNTWQDSTGVNGRDWAFGGSTVVRNASPTTAYPGIAATYVFDGSGGGETQDYEAFDDAPGSLEIWFRPADLTGDEILFETGGGSGTSLSLSDNILSFRSLHSGESVQVDFDLTGLETEFIQAVGTIDVTAPDHDAQLFVNGVLVGSDTNPNGPTDWTGGDDAGLGELGAANMGGFGGGAQGFSPFVGEIAQFRFYESILTDNEVARNFGAVTGEIIGGSIVAFDAISAAGGSVSLTLPTQTPFGETGVVTGLDEVTQSVTLVNTYTNPVVIATPSTNAGGDIVTSRISNLTGNGFDIVLRESSNLDGMHGGETVHYLVVEAGTYMLPNGMLIEAGTLDTNATTHGSDEGSGTGTPPNDASEFDSVTFTAPFTSTPVILSQVQSTNDTTPGGEYVNTRQLNASPSGVLLALEQDEISAVEHATETIGYIALSPGVGSAGGLKLEAFRTPEAVTEANYSLEFVQSFSSAPNLLGSISTYEGIDPSVLRLVDGSLTSDGATIFVQEDTSEDTETGHAAEIISYVAIGGSGVLTGVSGTVGDFTYDTNGQLEFVAAGETFTDTFTYTVADEFGDTAVGTVRVQVAGENDMPTAADDPNAATDEDTPLVIDVLLNDNDIDTTDVLMVDSVDDTGVMGTVTNNGTSITYDPAGAFDSLLDGGMASETFTYTITDGNGGTATASVIVTITGLNDAPVSGPVTGAAMEDGPAVTISFNTDDPDTDDDSTTLTYNLLTTPSEGTVVDNGNGTFDYDPGPGFQSLAAGETTTLTFDFNATDQHGATGNTITASIVITGVNDAPVADAGGPYAIQEGESLTLVGSATDVDTNDMLTYSWDLNNDGIFTDATGPNPTLTNAQLQAISPTFGDGPATFDVVLRVNDGTADSDSLPTTLTLTNAPPTVSIDGPSSAVSGFEFFFDLTATDPSLADQNGQFTYSINWNDGSPIQEVIGGAAVSVPHSFTSFGPITVSATVEDKDDGESLPDTHTINVVPVDVIGDDLYAGGTSNSDVIIFYPVSAGVRVRINDAFYPVGGGGFSFSGDMLAFGQAGNDRILVAGPTGANAVFDGGTGNDYLAGHTTDDTLIGGPGNDVLLGSDGQNFLDGGEDSDRIEGGDHSDLIFGGGGNDRLNGVAGDDILDGGDGNDLVFGGLGNDLLVGGAGFDTLNGHFGNDVILGGEGSDQIFGSNDHDLLIGGLGRDRMRGDAGDDDLIGGTTDLDAAIEADVAALISGGSLSAAVDAAINAWFASGSDRSGFGVATSDGVSDDLAGNSGIDAFSKDDGGRDFTSGETLI